MKRSALALAAAALTIAVAFFSSKACSGNQATVTDSQPALASSASREA